MKKIIKAISHKWRGTQPAIKISVFCSLLLMITALIVVNSNLKSNVMNIQTIELAEINSQDVYTSFFGNRKWLLLGNEFEKEDQNLVLTLKLNEKYLEHIKANDWTVSLVISGYKTETVFRKTEDLVFEINVDARNFFPGSYEALAIIDFGSGRKETTVHAFNVTYPVYVNWTIDWEGLDVREQYLSDMASIADEHDIPMTHFFNPRIYVTKSIPSDRAQYLTNWVLNRSNNKNEDIGLHFHMFDDMVAAAGVKPLENPIRWGSGIKGGYDTLTSNYSVSDMVKMLEWAKSIFVKNKLGVPSMFRAGGWYADEKTLTALEDSDFMLDSSGRTAYVFGKNIQKGHWELEETTQPYRMNSADQNVTNLPNMNLWEFPNNGSDSYKFSAEEMIERFYQNYDSKILSQKKVVNFLSHPHWFNIDKPKLDILFQEIDTHLYRNDSGPVIYKSLGDTFRILTK